MSHKNITPNTAYFYNERGVTHFHAQDFNKAYSDFRKAIDLLSPDDPNIYIYTLNVANSCHRLGWYEKAVHWYSETLASPKLEGGQRNNIKNTFCTVANEGGIFHFRNENYGKSYSLFKKAIAASSNNDINQPVRLLNLGNACQMLGLYEEAKEYYNHALSMTPISEQTVTSIQSELSKLYTRIETQPKKEKNDGVFKYFPEFPPYETILENVENTIKSMINSDEEMIRKAGHGLYKATRNPLSTIDPFFMEKSLEIKAENGSFIAAISYSLIRNSAHDTQKTNLYAQLIIGKGYLTLNETGKQIALAKEWFSLESLVVQAKYYQLTDEPSIEKVKGMMGSKRFRVEGELYGFVKVLPAYQRAKKIAIQEKKANPKHPFLLQQYEEIFSLPELSNVDPHLLRALDFVSNDLVDLTGSKPTDQIQDIEIDFSAAWWTALIERTENWLTSKTDKDVSRSFK